MNTAFTKRPLLRGISLAISLSCAAGMASQAYAKDVTWDDIVNDAETTQDVLGYGIGPKVQRYSPMTKINKKNVERMVPEWTFSFGDEKQRGQESQALVHDGVIYVTGSYSRIWALDAKTGKKLWDYSHRLPEGIRPCCDVVNRGAAIFGDKVFFGTLDAGIVALNKKTGDVVWREKFGDHEAGYTMTAAPTLVKNQETGKVLLIHGNSGDEFGAVGKLYARDPETGEEIWMRPFVEGHYGRLNGEKALQPAILARQAGQTIPIQKQVKSRPGATVAVPHGKAQVLMSRPTPSLLVPVTLHPGTLGNVPHPVGIQQITIVSTRPARLQ